MQPLVVLLEVVVVVVVPPLELVVVVAYPLELVLLVVLETVPLLEVVVLEDSVGHVAAMHWRIRSVPDELVVALHCEPLGHAAPLLGHSMAQQRLPLESF